MLRVADLLSDGASPLWSTTKGAPLGEAISATLEILEPRATDTARAA